MKSENEKSLDGVFRDRRPLSTLWCFVGSDRWRIAGALVVYVFKHSPTWILPIVAGKMINYLVDGIKNQSNESFGPMLVYALIMMGLYLSNVPLHMVFASLFVKACRNIEARLRSSLVRRLQQLSISFHTSTSTGRLQAKLLRDVEAIQRLMTQMVHTIVPGLLSVVFILSYCLYAQPEVALFFVAAVPVASVLRYAFRKAVSKRNREFRSRVEVMSGKFAEMISMIPVARAHALEEHEVARMEEELAEVRAKGLKLDMINELFGCTSWATFMIFRLLCLAVTGYMAYIGHIKVGDIIMYQGFYEILLGSVQMLLNAYPMMAVGMESVHSVGEILQSPDVEQNEGKAVVDRVEGRLTFRNVTFRYPGSDIPAIENFSLKIEPGQSVAVVGGSGAGKSTLMSLILGFQRPTSGQIILDGRDMNTLDLRTYRRFLAAVPQNTVLFSGSIRENISYGLPDITEKEIRQAIELSNSAEFVDAMPEKDNTRIGPNGAKLSGGQRQRIAIARAIVRNPRIIILDEATSSLDVVSELLVQEAIERLLHGRTTFVVAHRLSTIRKCDHIVVMRDGKCVEAGSHQALLDLKGEFFQLKSLQT